MSSDAWALPDESPKRLDEEHSVDIGPPVDADSNEAEPSTVEEPVNTERDVEPPD